MPRATWQSFGKTVHSPHQESPRKYRGHRHSIWKRQLSNTGRPTKDCNNKNACKLLSLLITRGVAGDEETVALIRKSGLGTLEELKPRRPAQVGPDAAAVAGRRQNTGAAWMQKLGGLPFKCRQDQAGATAPADRSPRPPKRRVHKQGWELREAGGRLGSSDIMGQGKHGQKPKTNTTGAALEANLDTPGGPCPAAFQTFVLAAFRRTCASEPVEKRADVDTGNHVHIYTSWRKAKSISLGTSRVAWLLCANRVGGFSSIIFPAACGSHATTPVWLGGLLSSYGIRPRGNRFVC